MNLILIGSFLLFSIAYIASIHLTPYPGDFVVKAIPALSLAALVLMNDRSPLGLLLVAALVFSAGGDIALSFKDGDKNKYFIVGLGLFLVAHIFYMIAFSRDLAYIKERLPLLILAGLIAVIMSGILVPRLGKMLIPVLLYIAVIAGMVVLAILHKSGGWILIAGAVLFMLSDSIIAINKFVFPKPQAWTQYAIMITYFAAQYLIVHSFVGGKALSS